MHQEEERLPCGESVSAHCPRRNSQKCSPCRRDMLPLDPGLGWGHCSLALCRKLGTRWFQEPRPGEVSHMVPCYQFDSLIKQTQVPSDAEHSAETPYSCRTLRSVHIIFYNLNWLSKAHPTLTQTRCHHTLYQQPGSATAGGSHIRDHSLNIQW